MKINLLKCDSVEERFRYIAGDYSDMFIDFFAKHNPGIKIAIYDVRAGQFPDIESECDGFVCTGSGASVYESAPWIIELKEYVRELYQQHWKFVGVYSREYWHNKDAVKERLLRFSPETKN